jgi:hypothetical protein
MYDIRFKMAKRIRGLREVVRYQVPKPPKRSKKRAATKPTTTTGAKATITSTRPR